MMSELLIGLIAGLLISRVAPHATLLIAIVAAIVLAITDKRFGIWHAVIRDRRRKRRKQGKN